MRRKIKFGERFLAMLIPFATVFCIVSIALPIFMAVLRKTQGNTGLTSLVMILVVAMLSLCFTVGDTIRRKITTERSVQAILEATERIAAGDFSARLKFGGVWKSYPAFNEMSASFNKMAEELENTEMLRGDFINNFSHEFKTPIVSIAGLAKLVNKGKLTEEQRAKYLTAIEEESLRLAAMATNVLKLTKVENQAILSDISTFNLSEQIRSCVLLLENKWERKSLELELDFREHEIEGNEELLKEVWINLLDNAVKFTPACGTVAVAIKEDIGKVSVTVSNTGSEISDENMKKIWNKFYQADESHSAEGNGVGLAIVKRVVDLHGGAISVKSGEGVTSFTVDLPVD
jgi:signal transduction histidine kinase